jgi:DNA-directed RNA polymerase specialized sigma24 family protein
MRFAEEKGIREIARELKRTSGAVKQLQFRGIQNLREQLEKGRRRKLGGPNG